MRSSAEGREIHEATVNFRHAIRELDGRQPEVMPEPSLDRMERLVELLDHPELTYPTIHVAGTNGKTTTVRLATHLACAHGLTTGAFTSPHLESVTERLTVCGEPIGEDEFGEEYSRLLPYLGQVDGLGRRITYFEALTALAFVWFSDKPVGLGVFEVGMGGSWDATNLVRGDVAVICPIGLDHVRQLGHTVTEVAGEKAGIVKEGRPAVIRRQRPEAMAVIERRAGDVGATLLVEDDAFALASRTLAVGGQSLSIRGPHAAYADVFLPLFGEEAARNAAAAVAACETLLDRPLDDHAVRRALGSASSPGRLEVVGRHPIVVLDGAHNPDAAQSLAAALNEGFARERLHLVVAMFDDKDVEGTLRHLAPLATRAYACRNANPRTASTDRVVAALRAAGLEDVEAFDSVADAVGAATEAAGEEDLILVTGSFYTVGDARPILTGPPS